MDDLYAFGKTTTNDVENYLHSHIGNQDGWCINSENRGSMYFYGNENVCDYYGWHAYKNLGTQQNTEHDLSPHSATFNSQTVRNCGSKKLTTTVSISATTGTEATTTCKASSGFTWEYGIDLKFVTSSFSFSMNVEVGHSETYTETNTVSQSVTVTVPAGKEMDVKMVGTQYVGSISYVVPAYVSGDLGSNYGYSANGHYFWRSSVADVVRSNYAELYGTADISVAMDAQVTVSPERNAKNC